MIKNTTLGILFYLRKEKTNKQGEAPIYVRITVDGKRAAVSTNRYIAESKWNNIAGRAKGIKEETKELNRYLDELKGSIHAHQRDMLERGKAITAETLKNALLGRDAHRYTLMEVFAFHNQQMKQKEGTEFASATITRYDTTLAHLKGFLKAKYNLSDIPLAEIDYKFVTDLEHYLKTKSDGQCNHNTTLKYIRNFRKIINMAVANNWLDKDPFLSYKVKLDESKRTYLDEEELAAIESKIFPIERLSQVRDIFVFCCYTGLAYVDVANLSRDNIKVGLNGKRWIFTYRQKTDIESNIPLLPQALAIIEKYADHPDCIYHGRLLPIRSNQKMNAYLKDIAELCGIKKTLHMHMGRHTFSTTVALANNVPMETLSKILGHKNMRTTQIYGKIVNKKVASDMDDLEKRLEQKAG